MANMITTIQIESGLKNKLDKLKVHPRESYNELIARLVGSESIGNMDKESLIETVEVLSDPEAMRNIAEALEEFEKGGGKSLREVEKELGLENV